MQINVFFSRLIEVLRLLASNFDIQKKVMPRGIILADEIALLFDDLWQNCDFFFKNHVINNIQMENLKKINNKLDCLSENQELWNDISLKSSNEWETIRMLSMETLKTFDKEYSPPFIDWIEIVDAIKMNYSKQG